MCPNQNQCCGYKTPLNGPCSCKCANVHMQHASLCRHKIEGPESSLVHNSGMSDVCKFGESESSAGTGTKPPTLPLLVASAPFSLRFIVLVKFKPVANDTPSVVIKTDAAPVLRNKTVRNHVPHHPTPYAPTRSVDGSVFKPSGPVAGPVMSCLWRRRVRRCARGRRFHA